MNSVVFYKEKNENVSLTEIIKAIGDLERGINSASSLDIPSFSYSSYLSSLPSKLSTCKKNCKKVEEWLNRSISNYDRYTEEIQSNFNKFVVSSIDEKTEHANALY